MSNNLPVSTTDLIGSLTKTVQRGQSEQMEGSYLRLTKGGFWVYGSDDIEVEEGALWAVDPRSFSTGFVAWGDSEILGEEMASIHADPIAQGSLPDVGVPWVQQVAMALVCINGEDKGTAVVYKNSSKGGRQRFHEFLQQVLAQYTNKPNSQDIVPVVELLEDSYKHKTYGKIFKPIFEIKQWLSMDDGFADVADEQVDDEPDVDEQDDNDPEPEPAKGKGTKKKAGRRRRRSVAS